MVILLSLLREVYVSIFGFFDVNMRFFIWSYIQIHGYGYILIFFYTCNKLFKCIMGINPFMV